MRSFVVSSLGLSLLFTACTVNTGSPGTGGGLSPQDDAGKGSAKDAGKDKDSGKDAGAGVVLPFSPSNLGSALAMIDTKDLVDVDVTANSQLGLTPAVYGVKEIMVTEAGGTTINVYVARSWKIEPTVVLSVIDNSPVVMVATTTIDVLGRIDASATSSDDAVSGGYTSSNGLGGPGGGGSGTNANPPDVGAGGGSFCGAGGAGGGATATQGTPGPTYGLATLIPLQGGSAGAALPGEGGSGGGAIQLVAATSVNVGPAGIISAGGGGGYGDGAGGAGGGILIEAPDVTMAGTLAVNGGGGGDGDSTGFGMDATPSATPAPGLTDMTSGAGGNGSAGDTIAGGDGVSGGASTASGAGGGGAGYIRINTTSGKATLTGGTLSPSLSTPCATQGMTSP